MMHFMLGLDLGPASVDTTLAIIQIVSAPLPPSEVSRHEQVPSVPAALHVRHLERYPVGTRYSALVADVKGKIQALPVDGRKPRLVVDATAVGAPVVGLFRAAGLTPVSITLVAGTDVTRDGTDWHVPKRDLASAMQIVLQTGRLKVADDLAEAASLREEMPRFTTKLPPRTPDLEPVWRDGTNEGLVLAVALAVWYAEHTNKGPRMEHIPAVGYFVY